MDHHSCFPALWINTNCFIQTRGWEIEERKARAGWRKAQVREDQFYTFRANKTLTMARASVNNICRVNEKLSTQRWFSRFVSFLRTFIICIIWERDFYEYKISMAGGHMMYYKLTNASRVWNFHLFSEALWFVAVRWRACFVALHFGFVLQLIILMVFLYVSSFMIFFLTCAGFPSTIFPATNFSQLC